MSTHTLRELRDRLGQVVDQVARTDEPATITSHGNETAVIISMDAYRAVADRVAQIRRERILAEARAAGLTISEDASHIVMDDAMRAVIESRYADWLAARNAKTA